LAPPISDIPAPAGSHLVTRPPAPGQAILLEAFVAARRDPEVAAMLREHLTSRADRLGELVETAKQTGAVDPALDTASVVHFAHAVGLGFLLFEAVGLPSPEATGWDGVLHRMIGALAVPTDPSPPSDPPDQISIHL